VHANPYHVCDIFVRAGFQENVYNLIMAFHRGEHERCVAKLKANRFQKEWHKVVMNAAIYNKEVKWKFCTYGRQEVKQDERTKSMRPLRKKDTNWQVSEQTPVLIIVRLNTYGFFSIDVRACFEEELDDVAIVESRRSHHEGRRIILAWWKHEEQGWG